jgi:RNA recognition motif-containing protein
VESHEEIGEYSVFVGDLGPEVNDYMLRYAFSRYKSLASARVIFDPILNTSKSKKIFFFLIILLIFIFQF